MTDQSTTFDGMDGDRRWWMGSLATIKVASAESGGRLSLVDCVLPPGVPVPPHLHTDQDETFYVLAGEISFRIGGAAIVAGPGRTLFVPRGTAHEFATTSSTPARYLFAHTPGGFDDFVRATSAPAPSSTLPPPAPPPTAAEIEGFVALMARHGMRPAH